MKNNKSGNRSRQNAEQLKEGGNEMMESLTTIFNRAEEEGQISLQWRETSIKPLYRRWIKRKNSEKPERYFHNKHSVQSI